MVGLGWIGAKGQQAKAGANLSLNINNRSIDVITRDPIAGFLFKWNRSTIDGMYHLEYERVQ